MKRLISLILAAVLLVPALVSCADKPGTAGSGVTPEKSIPAESTTGGTHPVDTDPNKNNLPTDTVTDVLPDVPTVTDVPLYEPLVTGAGEFPVSVGEASMDFCARLFGTSYKEGENVLVSPLSVMIALSMVEGGARGETLREMEAVLGEGMEYESFLAGMQWLLHTYTADDTLTVANGIWYRDGALAPAEDFRSLMGDVFDAPFRAGPFDDTTKDEINGWVKEHTDGMIDSILDDIPENAVMYLVNALCFIGKWEVEFEDVSRHRFINADGSAATVDMMFSDENILLTDDGATGFMKPYEGGRFAFAALLPDEGVEMSDYVASLTGDKVRSIINSAEATEVRVGLPKFTVDYKCDMKDALAAMGMPTLFTEMADLSGLGDCALGNMAVSGVFHKTHIEVDEAGTKAAAVTAVEVYAESAIMYANEVILDRPFVYMIVDTETGLPVFMGAMENFE